MSRTIRRTKALKHYSRFEDQYAEYRQGEKPNTNWRYFTDNGIDSFAFENAFHYPWREDEGCYRIRIKNEIKKWLEDREYEIIDQPHKLMWDLC